MTIYFSRLGSFFGRGWVLGVNSGPHVYYVGTVTRELLHEPLGIFLLLLNCICFLCLYLEPLLFLYALDS
jgi:hypothetical protein